MANLDSAVRQFETMDQLSRRDGLINRIHPLAKLLITMFYLVTVVSFATTDLTGLILMGIYPFILFELTGLSFREALRRLKIVLPLVMIMGVFNPIFNRVPAVTICGITFSEGFISMITLMIKGIYTVLSAYLLMATTRLEHLCYAMRLLHIPRIIVTEFMLICRYISVLLREAREMNEAYSLRAPGQNGIAMKHWGTFAGQLLLRSMDRAECLFESMVVRGFKQEFNYGSCNKAAARDYLYFFSFALIFLVLRLLPVAELIGGMFI